MKVVINRCYGGFSVSKAVYEKMGEEWDGYGYKFDNHRTDPKLIAAIEKIGLEKSSGACASLEIVNIPDEATDWEIEEYDGMEYVICVINGKIERIY